MLSEKMQAEFSEQVNKELYSSYLYLSMANYCIEIGYKGFAHWLKIQAQEEMEHAIKIYDFVIKRGNNISLNTIEKPDNVWTNLYNLFKNVLEHEQFITNSINHIVEMSLEENDFASVSFLLWFIDEQVEEEANAEELLSDIEMIGDNKCALFALDEKLFKRTLGG